MNIRTLLFFLLQLSILSALDAQVSTSDTIYQEINDRSYRFIKHNISVPIVNQFEFDQRLFFCNGLRVYERKQQGIELIYESEGPNFPVFVIPDNNNPSGYNIIHGTYQTTNTGAQSLVLLRGDFLPNAQIPDTIINYTGFINEYGPPTHESRQLLTGYFFPYTNPETSYSSYVTYFSLENLKVRSTTFNDGEAQVPSYHNYCLFHDQDTSGTQYNIGSTAITSVAKINNELYFYSDRVYKYTPNNLEQINNNFEAYRIGVLDDQLVMMGKNKMTIGTSEYQTDFTDLLDEIKNLFNTEDPQLNLKIDSQEHFWFNAPNTNQTIEVIFDDEFIPQISYEADIDLDRYFIETDTININEENESFTVIQHEVEDLIINKKFTANHAIDINGDVYITSDIGFLRRTKDGLVPVIVPEDNHDNAYFLTQSNNQLHPFNQYILKTFPNEINLIELVNNEFSGQYKDSLMMYKLMEVGDGRNFRIDNYFHKEYDHPNVSWGDLLNEHKHLFAWGKRDGDYVIEETVVKSFWAAQHVFRSEFTFELSFQNSILQTYNELGVNIYGYPTTGNNYHRDMISVLDVEIIRDSLLLFPTGYPQWLVYGSYFNPNTNNFHSLSGFGSNAGTPKTVTIYKEKPIYLFRDHLKIGHRENWVTFNLSELDLLDVIDIQVTDDNHIWLIGKNVLYEVIREQDLNAETELPTACSFNNTNLNFIQECTPSDDATVQIDFADNNRQADYNIYLNEEFQFEFSDTNSFTLSLATSSTTENFEIIIQNKSDLACKQTLDIAVNCIFDQDNDGFTNEIDCDDENADINPNAIDIPYNGIDEDCDGEDLTIDADGDGFNSHIDCDDENPNINPEAVEIPFNGIDENCDGEDILFDSDGDGFTSDIDCDDDNADINPDAMDIPYNGIDEDCDGEDLTIDADGDGFNSDIDCDDDNADINPEATDIPYNGIDEDCNGEDLTIDADGDGFNSDIDCDDDNADINPEAEEIPGNEIDEDCNGEDLTSIHHLEGLKISIFPNPVNNAIFIELNNSSGFNFKIYNTEGKLLSSGILPNNANHQINLEELPNGVYHLELQTPNGKGKIIEKIIKI